MFWCTFDPSAQRTTPKCWTDEFQKRGILHVAALRMGLPQKACSFDSGVGSTAFVPVRFISARCRLECDANTEKTIYSDEHWRRRFRITFFHWNETQIKIMLKTIAKWMSRWGLAQSYTTGIIQLFYHMQDSPFLKLVGSTFWSRSLRWGVESAPKHYRKSSY